MSLSPDQLTAYVADQMYDVFPDGRINISEVRPFVSAALERTEFCFSRINNKYFSEGGQTYLNHLHTDQYAMFLYYLANTIWRLEGEVSLAEKAYYLNKVLNGIDAFYEVELPDVFLLAHPLGTVLGRAQYSDYFVAYQGCTVGSKLADRPTMEEGVVLYGRSMLIGRCHIKQNCWIAPGAILMDMEIPENRVVFGCHPNAESKPATNNVSQTYFR